MFSNNIHCACIAKQVSNTCVEIKLCQLHYHAPEMMEILKEIVTEYERIENHKVIIQDRIIQWIYDLIERSDYTV